MTSYPEPSGTDTDFEGLETAQVARRGPRWRRRIGAVGRTAGQGLAQGVASGAGSALVTGVVWWWTHRH
jgi:hypothetical protein